MKYFNNLFAKISLNEKNDYLYNMLWKNEALRSAFMNAYQEKLEKIRHNSPKKYNKQELITEIEEEAELFKDLFEEIDLSNIDWEDVDEFDTYINEYDLAYDYAQEEVENFFDLYRITLKHRILHDDLTEISKELSVISHGLLTASLEDPYDIFYDTPPMYFIQEINYLFESFSDGITKRAFLHKDYIDSFELLFAFKQKHHPSENAFLELFKPFFKLAIKNKEEAQIAWDALQKYNIDLSDFPEIIGQIAYLQDDKTLWIKQMENMFLKDFETSIKLLDYYYANNKELFEEKARQFNKEYKYKSLQYLINKVRKGTQLHISLLKDYIQVFGDHSYFRVLTQYLSEDEQKAFMASIPDKNIKANLYGKEAMHEELEKLIRKELPSFFDSFWGLNFMQVIRYLYDAKPETAWELTVLKIDYELENTTKHRRKKYQYLAQLLKQSMLIPGKYKYVKSKISELYQRQPRLPALKDEFKKAGLKDIEGD